MNIPYGYGNNPTSLYALLVQKVTESLSSTADVTSYDSRSVLPDDGFQCIATNSDCLGGNRDTPHLVSPRLPFPAEGTSFFVVGINHTASGLATYSNVSIYSAKDKRGVKSERDDE